MISWFSCLVLVSLACTLAVANLDRRAGRGPERFLAVVLVWSVVMLVLALLRAAEVLP